MDEKRKIIESLMPLAVLKALTPAAQRALPQPFMVEGFIALRRYPFRVGRESRVKIVDGRVERIERVKIHTSEPNNDIYLIDDGHLLNISREHFQIEKDGDKYFIYDRGSACGTRVGDDAIGIDNTESQMELKDGDIITLGTKSSPYTYQFILLDQFELTVRK